MQRINERKTSTTTQKNTKIYPGKPSWGRKPSKYLLYIRCIKDKPKTECSILLLSLSLSLLCTTQVSECVFK